MGTVALRLTAAVVALGEGTRRRAILSGLDLEVHDGELLTVVGPSGSGKSTLLAVLAGLVPLDGGCFDLGEGGGGHHPGIVFQDPLLLPWLTVADNVALGLRYRRHRPSGRGRRARADRLARARAVLDELGIGELADRMPSELSGGQAQRVAVARAIVVEPSVLLLDEPFGALDPRTRRALQQWLLELRQRLRLTVVLVTHDVDEALYLGDRVAVLPGAGRSLELVEAGAGDRAAVREGSARIDLLDRLGVSLDVAPA